MAGSWERRRMKGGRGQRLGVGFWGVNKATGTYSDSTMSAFTSPPVILAVMHALNLLIIC
jgi:hypothetical protein